MKELSFKDKIELWLDKHGKLNVFAKTILIVSIIVAVVFAAIGVPDVLAQRADDSVVATEDAFLKAQKAEYDKLVKAAKSARTAADRAAKKAETAATKAAEETDPEKAATLAADAETKAAEAAAAEEAAVAAEALVPESQEAVAVEKTPVTVPLKDYAGYYFLHYLVWSIVSLAAGFGLYKLIVNADNIKAALQKAGKVKVVSELCYILGLIGGAVLAVLGIIEIMGMNKVTMGEVGAVLVKKYLVWAFVCVASGFALRYLIQKLPGIRENTFDSVGLKLTQISQKLFCITVVLFPFALIGAVVVAVLVNLYIGIALAALACVLLVALWITSLALHATGTCSMILEPQAKAAAEREELKRNAKTWECPDCQHVNPIYQVDCGNCGSRKPTRDKL